MTAGVVKGMCSVCACSVHVDDDGLGYVHDREDGTRCQGTWRFIPQVDRFVARPYPAWELCHVCGHSTRLRGGVLGPHVYPGAVVQCPGTGSAARSVASEPVAKTSAAVAGVETPAGRSFVICPWCSKRCGEWDQRGGMVLPVHEVADGECAGSRREVRFDFEGDHVTIRPIDRKAAEWVKTGVYVETVPEDPERPVGRPAVDITEVPTRTLCGNLEALADTLAGIDATLAADSLRESASRLRRLSETLYP